ncbi:MAG TPA: type II toxin-antitoxin system VapC family toxin [Candidatus Methylacidiphilales bacterium]|jgi:tRNA(fMet)-specific endonuclease VapC|nr:type II toxin-antitoxin system VapC family toxin [Candidatus Methylacidiphilales bacterium]
MPETGSLLLDTTVVVAIFRRIPGIREQVTASDELLLPLFALGELEYGVHRSSQPQRQRDAVSAFCEGVLILAPGDQTAREYGLLKAELALAGTPIPENDIWIAALAREHGLTLATLDAHFQRITNLQLFDWI